MKLRIVAFLLGLVSILYTQPYIPVDAQELHQLAQEFQSRAMEKKQLAQQWASQQSLTLRQQLENGRVIQVVGWLENRPVFYSTNNVDAAVTTGTSTVWPTAGGAFSLDGASLFSGSLAMWDAGGILTTHQEFGTRASQIDVPASGSYHATHVAGTIIAQGVDLNANGMASAAGLFAYDWNDDFNEMALAASGGLLLSNHSYGEALGWCYNFRNDNLWAWLGDINASTTEDYRFGLYTSYSQSYDQISYNAPYYLIVQAAGNDRVDTGPALGEQYWYINGSGNWELSTVARDPDGPYDCIDMRSIAKNILTVGAIDDITDGNFSSSNINSKMSTFSSWGPADDGRIKPDIMGNGVGVYSTTNADPASYGLMSGTSMASPNVMGSLALLQELYIQNSGSLPMRSATLKGLVIHTAREAGLNPGPDYQFGWGLLDVPAAAQVIADDVSEPIRIQELALDNSATMNLQVTSDGSEPLNVTICWTDLAGTPDYQLNPRTPMLVNDLDMRIVRDSDSQLYYPWRLDVENPSNAATRDVSVHGGDNDVDNVERIVIENPTAGSYTVQISHKGILQNSPQAFSMILTGATPLQTHTLTLSADDGGSTLPAPGSHSFNSGSEVSVSAQPFQGFQFSGWSGDETSTDNPLSVIMDADKTLHAGFTQTTQINTSLQLENNSIDTPVAGEGTLVLNVLATATQPQNIGVQEFSGGFYLDANLAQQVLQVSFANSYFNPLDYNINRQESYDDNAASATYGRVYYHYEHDSGPIQTISDSPAIITQVIIRYTMSSDQGSVAWSTDPIFTVTDGYGNDMTGIEETPLPQDLIAIPLPIELSLFTAERVATGVELTWQTQSETENMGFNIYRSPEKDGSFNKVNVQLISGAGSSQALHEYRYTDESASSDQSFYYRLSDIDFYGNETFHQAIFTEAVTPLEFTLRQNYPNPFNPSTTIPFVLGEDADIELAIYNQRGQLIRILYRGFKNRGEHSLRWDGTNESGQIVPSGVYFCRLVSEHFAENKKMIFMK